MKVGDDQLSASTGAWMRPTRGAIIDITPDYSCDKVSNTGRMSSSSVPTRSDADRDTVSALETIGASRMMQGTSNKQRRYSHAGLSTTSDVSGKSGVTGQQGPTERSRRVGVTQVQYTPEVTPWNSRGKATPEALDVTTTERHRKKSHASFFSGTDGHQPLFAKLQNVLSASRATTTSNGSSSGRLLYYMKLNVSD